MYNLRTMAGIAYDVYRPASHSVMLRDWHTSSLKDGYEDDNFLMRVYWRGKSQRDACVCFRGTDSWKDWIVADLAGIGLGLNSLALKLNIAMDITQEISRKAETVWLTGHSLGGAYVQLVGAILKLPGITWNAPGALALLNQMSKSPVRAVVGGAGSAAVGLLADLALLGLGKKVVDALNMAVAATSNDAFPPIVNFRGDMDPVSRVGWHVGAPIQTIKCATHWPHPHSMLPIISALGHR